LERKALDGWKNADLPEIGGGGLTFETLYGPAVRAREHFELLRYVDPYGETVFNRLQIDTVLDEFGASSRMPGSLSTSEHTID
jgi:hypothetical protein